MPSRPTRHPKALTATLLAALLLAGPGRSTRADEPGAVPEDPHRVEGRRLTQRTFGLLSSNLLQAIRVGGTTNALEFCSVHALPLTSTAATNSAATVRRLTHRPRNPANRAADEDLAVIEVFRRDLAPGRIPDPQVRTNRDGSVTFRAAIILNNPLCLTCHGAPGTEVQPATLEALRRLYPDDQATGFRLGELRGIWRVDFPAPDR